MCSKIESLCTQFETFNLRGNVPVLARTVSVWWSILRCTICGRYSQILHSAMENLFSRSWISASRFRFKIGFSMQKIRAKYSQHGGLWEGCSDPHMFQDRKEM